jgi:hypothetical protein
MLHCTENAQTFEWNDIDLIDTPGFTVQIDKKINEYYKEHECNAIVLVTNDRFSRDEVRALVNLDQKPVMVFYVRNKYDSLLEGFIDSNDFTDEEKTTFINDHLIKLKQDLNFCIESHCGKASSVHSNYLTTATMKKFLDPKYSPDGARLRDQLKEIKNINNGECIDLKLPNYNLIHYKKKILQDQLWNFLNTRKMFTNSLTSIVPLLDIFVKESMIRDNENFFLEQFGIQEIIDIVNNKDTDNAVKLNFKDEETRQKLIELVKKIENEKYQLSIEKLKSTIMRSKPSTPPPPSSEQQQQQQQQDVNLDKETDSKQNNSTNNETQLSELSNFDRFKNIFSQNPNATSLTIRGAIGAATTAAAVSLEASTKLISAAAAIIVLPPLIAYFIYTTNYEIKKILLKVEDYAFEMHNLLHGSGAHEKLTSNVFYT